MTSNNNQPKLIWKNIPDLEPLTHQENHQFLWRTRGSAGGTGFACVSMPEKKAVPETIQFTPTAAQLLKHPLAVVALVPKQAALFYAGAVAGAAANTVTAPLDRIKLIIQFDENYATQLLFYQLQMLSLS